MPDWTHLLFSRKSCSSCHVIYFLGKLSHLILDCAVIEQVHSIQKQWCHTHCHPSHKYFCVTDLLSHFCVALPAPSHCCTSLTEKDLKTKCVVEMEGNQTILNPAMGNMGKGDTRYALECWWWTYIWAFVKPPQLLWRWNTSDILSWGFTYTSGW